MFSSEWLYPDGVKGSAMSDESFFERNLAAIRTTDPESAERIRALRYDSGLYRRIRAKNGLPVLEVLKEGRRVSVGSRTDPRLEAARLARAALDGTEQLIVLLGIGSGYLLEEARGANPDARIVIIEPELCLFAEIMKTWDLTSFLGGEQVVLLLEPDSIDFDELVPHPSVGNVRLVISRPYRALFQEKVHRIERDFQSYVNGKRINITTLKRFDRLWTKNIFKNCAHFFTLPGVEALRDGVRGFPAVILAAGPSQEAQLPLLEELQDRVILIAVDTAAQPLMQRHIVPDFIVTVDPQYINSHYVARMETYCDPAACPVLVADPAVYPTVLRMYPGPMVLTSSVFSPGKVIERFSGVKGSIAAGGSVATAAFDLGRILGAEPLFMLGLDLSYGMGKTHLSGSLVERYLLTRMNRFSPLLSHTLRYMRGGEAVPLKDKRGGTVFTDRRMLLYRSWFEHQMRTEKRKICNITAGGLSIEGMPDEPAERLGEYTRVDTALKKRALMDRIRSFISKASLNRAGVEDFTRYLGDTAEQLGRLQEIQKRAMELTEALLHSPSDTDWGELGDLDARLLSFEEPNRLISMVMQASIHQVLSRRRVDDRREALEISRELYKAMSEATFFIAGLVKVSMERLKKNISCRRAE
jgi:hypothetical protein